MENIIKTEIFRLLKEIFNLEFNKDVINERYLHHYFSNKIQNFYPIDLIKTKESKLHCEWATKNNERLKGGAYKKEQNSYLIAKNGYSGFIDFVFGRYSNPEYALEFKLLKSWRFESIVFDFMKLLDNANSINKVISFTIIFREGQLSNKLNEEKLKKTISVLQDRLKDNKLARNREFLFWIIEVSIQANEKKSWYCKNIEENFIQGIPEIS